MMNVKTNKRVKKMEGCALSATQCDQKVDDYQLLLWVNEVRYAFRKSFVQGFSSSRCESWEPDSEYDLLVKKIGW